ncbi:MAG: chemotaxis protein CheA [Bacteroidota bacterium]
MNNEKKENEYKELFLAEAMDNYEEISRLLIQLEKKPTDRDLIQSLFRITHTLKGNAAGMGFNEIAELAHVIEDLFAEIRDQKIELNPDLFSSIFKGVDILGSLISAIKDEKTVRYKGIKTKLEVIIRNNKKESNDNISEPELNNEEELDTIEDNSDNEEIEVEDQVTNGKISLSDLVQVPVGKLDNLLNLVGELIIERDRLIAMNSRISNNEFSRLNRISSDLQYSVMNVRLVQVGFLFNKFHRIVRDIANKEEKKVNLVLEGSDTEIDRNILHVISDSMIHLVRNAIGHGIENTQDRKAQNKKEEGELRIRASSESDNVILEIIDDGAGINTQKIKDKALAKGIVSTQEIEHMSQEEILMLIFQPGFSTNDEVNDISGRGVGMDVVKQSLDSIGGTIQMESEIGRGSKFILNLPSSMAVKSTLLFELDQQVYGIPLNYTESVISIQKKDIRKAFKGWVTVNQGNTVILLHLSEILSNVKQSPINQSKIDSYSPEEIIKVIIVKINGKRLGFIVDHLLQQKEIIEKPLLKPVENNPFLSGVTIMGNGNVCLVLSVPGIANNFLKNISQNKKTIEHA